MKNADQAKYSIDKGEGDSISGLMEALDKHPALREELRQVLGTAAQEAERGSVAWRLKLMQHPIFSAIARLLEESVPREVGFGKFRGHDK